MLLPLHKFKRRTRCPQCNGWMHLVVGGTPLIWKPITLEHIADVPMTFNKRSDLVKYCREHGLASSALL